MLKNVVNHFDDPRGHELQEDGGGPQEDRKDKRVGFEEHVEGRVNDKAAALVEVALWAFELLQGLDDMFL